MVNHATLIDMNIQGSPKIYVKNRKAGGGDLIKPESNRKCGFCKKFFISTTCQNNQNFSTIWETKMYIQNDELKQWRFWNHIFL